MGAGGDEDTKLNKTVSSRTSQSIKKIGIYNIFIVIPVSARIEAEVLQKLTEGKLVLTGEIFGHFVEEESFILDFVEQIGFHRLVFEVGTFRKREQFGQRPEDQEIGRHGLSRQVQHEHKGA